MRINVTAPGKRGRSEDIYEIVVLPGRWEKVTMARSKAGASAGAQEKQQGQGQALGSSHGLDVLRAHVSPAPAASFLRANQGKRNQSGRQREFTTTDSKCNRRQFVLRCYCTFPVLITNYDSITPTWQFVCSCLR